MPKKWFTILFVMALVIGCQETSKNSADATKVASGTAATAQNHKTVTPKPATSPPKPKASKASIVTLSEATTREAPSGKGHIRALAQGAHAFVGMLRLDPDSSVPEHKDESEEVIHVLSGHGTIKLDGEAREVGPGDTILMPAGVTVSYQNGDEPLVALQVFSPPKSAKKYNAWKADSTWPTAGKKPRKRGVKPHSLPCTDEHRRNHLPCTEDGPIRMDGPGATPPGVKPHSLPCTDEHRRNHLPCTEDGPIQMDGPGTPFDKSDDKP